MRSQSTNRCRKIENQSSTRFLQTICWTKRLNYTDLEIFISYFGFSLIFSTMAKTATWQGSQVTNNHCSNTLCKHAATMYSITLSSYHSQLKYSLTKCNFNDHIGQQTPLIVTIKQQHHQYNKINLLWVIHQIPCKLFFPTQVWRRRLHFSINGTFDFTARTAKRIAKFRLQHFQHTFNYSNLLWIREVY